MDTIGFMELSSIAAGIESADDMLKSADVELIFAKASCPGKYYILVGGNASAVEASMKNALEMGECFVVSSVVIHKIHKQVISAINMSCMPENPKAIGVLEFFSVASAIIAADTAVKSANVELIDVRLGTGIGGKSFVVLTGELNAVEAAQTAGSQTAIESGMLVNKTVIAKPRAEIIESLY
jgi:microcompartment protein CcmL/EutN